MNRLPGMCGAVLLVTAGCGTPSLYRWGGYEPAVALMYSDPGAAGLGKQIGTLARDIERARRGGKPIAPGVRAHLGYLCYLNGDVDAALEHFEAEGRAYPESATFIDVLVEQVR